jgi:hypothetical protein
MRMFLTHKLAPLPSEVAIPGTKEWATPLTPRCPAAGEPQPLLKLFQPERRVRQP